MSGWRTVPLGELLTESRIEAKASDPERRITVKLNLKGVQRREPTAEKEGATRYYVRKAGQFIYGKQNLHKGAFGVVPKELDGFQSSSDLPAFDVAPVIAPEWIHYWLVKGDTWRAFEKLARGVGSRRTNVEDFLRFTISYPSDTAEQRRIIRRIQATELQHATLTTELTHQRALLKQLRQAILQEAVQGKLTEAWRGSHPELVSGPHHASELLKRIRAEKEALVKEGKLRKPKPLPSIKPEEVPFALPEGWVWCRLGEITHTITKGSSPRWQAVRYVDENAGILFVTSENVGDGRMLWDNKKYVEKKFNEIEPRSILTKGDLLVNIVGASIGRSAEYDLDEVANVNQAVCLIRLVGEVSHQYILQLLNSPVGVDQMFDRQIDHARANLSMGNIAEFMVPLPPAEEQMVILDAIDAVSHKLADLANEVESVHTITASLLQSVLSEVMGGPGAVRYTEADGELPLAAEPQVRQGGTRK